MAYEYRNRRTIPSPTDLTDLDQQRLPIAAKRYDGEDLSLSDRLEGADDGERANLVSADTEIWEIYEDGTHVFDLWHYMVDSGTIFVAGTTEVFGEVIQFGFGGIGGMPNAIATQLEAAYRTARAAHGKT